MHILVTADTVGGVWSYTRELVTGLDARGIHVTLVSFGGLPTPAQRAWLDGLQQVEYLPTEYRLEWMPDAAEDIQNSKKYLREVIARRKPQLLHLSQFCYGSLNVSVPSIVVAHSDVMSWFRTVHGSEPRDAWASWYRKTVSEGLAGASAVVSPSCWMLDVLEACYGRQRAARVIYNGRTPSLFNPDEPRQNDSRQSYAVSVGRLWDEGKQASLLTQLSGVMPIVVAGSGGDNAWSANLQCRGQLSEAEMIDLLSKASVYVATSKYEPFGLAPLEAALSGCAIVANDIPSFREIWGEAALYFRANDANSLRELLLLVGANDDLRREYAYRAYRRACHHYTAEEMVTAYVRFYSALLERQVTAA